MQLKMKNLKLVLFPKISSSHTISGSIFSYPMKSSMQRGINGIVFRFLVGLYWVLIGRFNIGAEGQSGLCHSLVPLLHT